MPDRERIAHPGGLTAQLAALGREAAREAWAEHAGELASVPPHPTPKAWTHLERGLALVAAEQRLTDRERRTFEHAYANGLLALAAEEDDGEEEEDASGAAAALIATLNPGDRIEIGGSGDGIVRVLLARAGGSVMAGLGRTVDDAAHELLSRKRNPPDTELHTGEAPTRGQLLTAADELENVGNYDSEAGRSCYVVADWLRLSVIRGVTP